MGACLPCRVRYYEKGRSHHLTSAREPSADTYYIGAEVSPRSSLVVNLSAKGAAELGTINKNGTLASLGCHSKLGEGYLRRLTRARYRSRSESHDHTTGKSRWRCGRWGVHGDTNRRRLRRLISVHHRADGVASSPGAYV